MPGAGGQPPQRTTFRPPWVKDGPNPLPMPTAPWTLNSRRDSKPKTEEVPAFTQVTLKSVPKPAESAAPSSDGPPPPRKPAFEGQPRKPSSDGQLRKPPSDEQPRKPFSDGQPRKPPSDEQPRKPSSDGQPRKPPSDEQPRKPSSDGQPRKQSKITIIPSPPKNEKIPSGRPMLRENGRQEPNSRPQLERQVRIERSRSRGDSIPLSKSESTTGAPTLSKSSSRANIPPPPPPRPPPPPPARTVLKDLPLLNNNQMQKLEILKSRPRKRPDWASMMKEVESGKTLRHVKCNDRSAPLIERVNKVTADSAGDRRTFFDFHEELRHRVLSKPNFPLL